MKKAKIRKPRKPNKHKKVRELADIIKEIKHVPCMDCGIQYPPYCMDFDHRDSTHKRDNVSSLVRRAVSTRILLDEISKCDIVCSNCHRERTHGPKPKKIKVEKPLELSIPYVV